MLKIVFTIMAVFCRFRGRRGASDGPAVFRVTLADIAAGKF